MNFLKHMPPVFRSGPFALVAAALALSACASTDAFTEKRSINIVDQIEEASAEPASKNELVSQVGPSFLTLTVAQKTGKGTVFSTGTKAITSGSAFLVNGDGTAMTAAHVAVAKGNVVTAQAADGRKYTGVVIDVIPEKDMAILQLKGFRGKPVSPSPRACVPTGSAVFSLGRPHAQGETARFGQLESMHFGRPVRYGDFGYDDAMVLRMGTQKGESGGPVFDSQGNLVGMVVSTLSDTSGRPLNLAHAVPASSLASFLCQRMACGSNWATLTTQSTADCPRG